LIKPVNLPETQPNSLWTHFWPAAGTISKLVY
jgi:hypothetical protein